MGIKLVYLLPYIIILQFLLKGISKIWNLAINPFKKMAGWLLYVFKKHALEKRRITVFDKYAQEEAISIIREILKYSKTILLLVILSVIIAFYLDFLFELITEYEWVKKILNSFHGKYPEIGDIKLMLEIFIGAISVLLGIIFALYSMAFENYANRYSDKIIAYLNEEKVANNYFKLLVFVDIYLIVTLLKVLFFPNQSIVFSFLIAIFFVSISLSGIIILKRHFLLSLSPSSIFVRILSESIQKVSYARKDKFDFYGSYSSVIHLRNRTRHLLDVYDSFLKDLIRLKKIDDVNLGLHLLGNFLLEYIHTKNFFDTNTDWWFFQEYQDCDSDDINRYPIKANFESLGITPYRYKAGNKYWLEDNIKTIIQEIENSAKSSNNNLLKGVIDFYGVVLGGTYTQQDDGTNKKNIHGLYESQEFDLFEKLLHSFFQLYPEVKKNGFWKEYLNACNQIRIVIIDGFNKRSTGSMPKSWKEDFINFSKKCISKNQIKKKKVELSDIRALQKSTLLDYCDKLQLEIDSEGSVITPLNICEDEMMSHLASEELRIKKKYFHIYLNNIQKIINDDWADEDDALAEYIRMQLMTLQQLVNQSEEELAEELVKKLKKSTPLLQKIDREKIIEKHFDEWIEKPLFHFLVKRNKECFLVLLVLMLTVLNQYRAGIDKSDTERGIKYARRILVIGGLAYLISEFYQDKYFINLVMNAIKSGYCFNMPIGQVVELMEFLNKNFGDIGLNFRINVDESTRYRHYFLDVISQIRELPKEHPSMSGASAISFRSFADHPSAFIRRLSEFEYSDMDECIDGFVKQFIESEKTNLLRSMMQFILNQ